MTRTEPSVAVVTPVLDGERYVAETVRSVIAQTEPSWEHVVVDGGSTDGTLALVRRFAAEDERITVLSEPDGGMYDAILKGLARTTAPLCCWINADDMLLPWAFRTAREYLADTGAQWVTGTPGVWDARGNLRYVEPPQAYPRWMIRRGWFHDGMLGSIQQESVFFTRSLLERVGREPLERVRTARLAGDFLLWTEMARHAELHTVPTVLSGFRVHEGNASGDAGLYLREIAEAGYAMPPGWIQRTARMLIKPWLVGLCRRRTHGWRERVRQGTSG